MKSFLLVIFLAVLASGLTACGSSSGSITAPPAPTPTPLQISRAYVTNGGSQSLTQYALPLTAATTLTASTQVGYAVGIAFDPSLTHLFAAVDTSNGPVNVYNVPVTSTPAFSLNLFSQPVDVKTDSAGNLYILDNNAIKEIKAPITSTSTVAFTSQNLNSPSGIAVDSSGSVYVATLGKPFPVVPGNITIFPAPFGPGSVPFTINSTGTMQYGDIAFDQTGRMFALTSSSKVEVYNSPFNAASKPAFTFNSGVGSPFYMAFDPSGNLAIVGQGGYGGLGGLSV